MEHFKESGLFSGSIYTLIRALPATTTSVGTLGISSRHLELHQSADTTRRSAYGYTINCYLVVNIYQTD